MAKSQDVFFDILRHLLSLSRPRKRLTVMTVDALLCCVAAAAAFALRLGEWNGLSRPILIYIAVALVAWFAVFKLHGVYRAIFRYAGSRTMVAMAYATGIMAIPLVAIFMLASVPGVPRTIALIHSLLFLALLCLSRIVSRYFLVDLLTSHSFRGDQKNVLIYGAGAAGRQLASSMQLEPGMFLCGFVDDDARLDGQRLDGHPVFHSAALSDIVNRFDVKAVLLALPRISRSTRKRIVAELETLSVQVQTLPDMKQLLDGKISVDDLQQVQIEDLLGRDPVAPNELLLGRTIRGKSVLVTGAGGSIGSELCRQIVRLLPSTLVLADNSEYALYTILEELTVLVRSADLDVRLEAELCDVTSPSAVDLTFKRRAPDTVFHAAAYKHVPIVEANPLSGLKNNILGTLAVARAAHKAGVARFVLISTDKAVRPTNVMGATKRIAELVVQALADTPTDTKFAMVRFGNVLGSSGSVVPLFEKQIRDGGPVTITHPEVTRYFMTIPEAAQLVIQAGAMATGGEVYVLDMGESVKIVDLARSMIRLSGLTIRDTGAPDGDVEIRVVGLRPGEKLYEELLIGDNPEPTRHERIMRAQESFLAWSLLEKELADLSKAIDAGDTGGAIEVMRRLVPEFAPAAHDTARQIA